MVFSNSFRCNVVARVLLLAALLFLILWSVLRTTWDATPLVAAALLAIAIIEMIRYVERGTRDLRSLMRAVAAGDFTSALPRSLRKAPFSDYEEASRTLISTYRQLDLRRAASDELLQAVIGHVGAPVLCFTTDGRIVFANAAARTLFDAPLSGSIDALATIDAALPQRLRSLADGERAQLPVSLGDEPALLLLHARRFVLLDRPYCVVACHDVQEEMETRDMAAWQALTRVLTHEMMNSLTPIITLSGLLRETVEAQRRGDAIPGEDLGESIEVIHDRSTGLARFILAYRQFSNPPAPAAARIMASQLLENVARLKRPELQQSGIQLNVRTAPDTTLLVDGRQIEQVLINLIRNAQDALTGRADGCIELSHERDARGRCLIHVTDNGPGVAPEILDTVFVPFFTTRSGGTGIGLSLSRQIVQMNRGSISVGSVPGRCRFTLRLPGA